MFASFSPLDLVNDLVQALYMCIGARLCVCVLVYICVCVYKQIGYMCALCTYIYSVCVCSGKNACLCVYNPLLSVKGVI